jgi:dolichol-phosphate mannosyltransferase
MKTISIVISAYNEQDNLIELHKRLKDQLDFTKYEFELVFVNDGSKDKSLQIMTELQQSDPSVKIVNLLRNFGHEMAMTAGMEYSKGDATIFMDADLQHPPEIIPILIEKWENGNDLVLTKRIDNKGQNRWEKLRSKIFYKILNSMSDVEILASYPDFRLISKRYVQVLKQLPENKRMFRGLISWLGIPNYTVVDFEAPERFAGKSKYNQFKLLGLAIDSLISFSIRPLRIATFFGVIGGLSAIIMGIFFIIQFLSDPNYSYSGYGTTILLVTFIGSIQLIVLGIIGEYIGRIHIETKKRPLYIAEFIEKND